MKDLRNKLIIGALFGAVVVVGLLLYTDLRDVGGYIRRFPLPLLSVVLALTLFNYALRWVKWHYYLTLIGVENISPLDSAALFVSGFVLALSPGKVAELLKAAVLRGMTGTPIARSAPVIPAERITDGLAMLVLGAIGFGGMLATSAEHSDLLLGYLPAYFVVLGLLMAGIVVIQIRPLFLWLLGLFERLPLVGRISHTLHELYESSYELFRPRPLLLAVALGVISWSGECVGFFLILRGMGLEPSWLLLWQATFMLAAATIIGAVSGLPGGLGAAEFSIAGMVQLLVLGYEDPGFAGTATILVRLFTLWFGVVLGLLTAFVFRRRLFPDHMDQLWQATQAEADPVDS
ncbi:MAG TPA: flippase-like domain-containing protein [Chloroflexi bacterium]|nr:flippase-like domain-containing protein [Chloroflexota bacterium]